VGFSHRPNFETLLRMDDGLEQVNLPQMFSRLSSNIAEYPNTQSLKMHARIQERGLRPHFHLERADHPLCRGFHEGITPERVKEIMFRALPPQPRFS
jgi:hypothetical protein